MSQRIIDSWWFGPGVLLALVLALFWPTFAAGPETVVSAWGGDVQSQFAGWRSYGFERLAAGDVPLWNPYLFAGQPFVGNWQTALFYPPNWLHFLLPLGPAITVIVAGHVYLAGLLMSFWLRHKGFAALAALFGGAVYMLSAPVLGHVFPGHITWVCVVAWTPLVFCAVDGLLDSGRWRFAWLGAGAVGMMVLAGYPQPVYITIFGAGVYTILAAWSAPFRWRPFGGLALMLLLGGAMGAIQALPGMEAGSESVRAGGAPWVFATSYSMPWENLWLILSPRAMGGPGMESYTGQWALWEVWPYAGTVAAVLAATGAALSPKRRWAGTMVVLFLLIAAGKETPLYAWIYKAIPGAGSFRVPGRYLLIVSLFAAVLAAAGIDQLLKRLATGDPREIRIWRRMMSATSLAALGLVGIACICIAGNGLLQAPHLLITIAVLGVTMGLALLAGRWKHASWGVLVLGIGELVTVGFSVVQHSPTELPISPAWKQKVATAPPDTRILVEDNLYANLPLWLRKPGLSGYDPFQSRRWAQFMAATQGEDPRDVSEIYGEMKPHKAWGLLRPGLVLSPQKGLTGIFQGALPRAMIVNEAEVMEKDVTRLSRLMNPQFDFTRTVLLEKPPQWLDPVETDAGNESKGWARVVADEGDRLIIEANVSRRAILVVTDTYAQGWRAWKEETGESLPVMPANHVVRGVAVTPGKYRVVMEYRPWGWEVGKWLTAAGLAIWIIWGILLFRRTEVGKAQVPIT